MNSFIQKEKKKTSLTEVNHVPTIVPYSTITPSTCLMKVFSTISILILYMILMSEIMMSQTITDEFIYVSVRGNKRNT